MSHDGSPELRRRCRRDAIEDAFAFPSLRMNWLTPVLLKISADFGHRVGPAAMDSPSAVAAEAAA
jgi:hypothetical protein